MGCGTIAGLALSLAGAGTQEVASSNAQDAMNGVTQNEINQQNQFAQKGKQVFQQSLGQSTPAAANKQIQQGTQQAANSITQAQAVPLSAQESARQGLSNSAASNYYGQSNYPLQQYLKDLSANSQLGVIGNQSAQVARNFPVYLQQAQQSQNGLAGIGSLLGTAGGLLGMYSASQPTNNFSFGPTASQAAWGNQAPFMQLAGVGLPNNIGSSSLSTIPTFY
jgi:hypothetical protein